MYCPRRRLPFHLPGAVPDTRRRFFLQHNRGEPACGLDPAGRGSAVNDGHIFALRDHKVSWSSAPEVPGEPFLAE